MWARFFRASALSLTLAPAVLAGGPGLPERAFRPQTPIAPLLVRAVDSATGAVRAALYELDLEPAGRALLEAHHRGVRVQVLVDEGALFPRADDGSPAPLPPALAGLLEAGVEVRALRGAPPYGSMHTKFALFDARLLADGSYNWTRHSEDLHFDDIEFLRDAALIRVFGDYFAWMWRAGLPAAEVLKRGAGGAYPGLEPAEPPRAEAPGPVFGGEGFPAVSFSPGGGSLDRVVRAARLSSASVDAAMFSFHAFPAAGALAGAHRRGLRVRVLLDRDQAAGSPVTPWLVKKGVEVRLLAGPMGPGPHSRMHHKFALFDGRLLASGSFNWSFNADRRSFEVLRFSGREGDVAAFQAWFDHLWALAEPAGKLIQ